eukprot:TRINITY_DN593_c0_g2_i2.p1 TRINITY_DN593_c0_g2~~TRINITY_DN593_c0_g2_i2.p1  ORF type:complete len:481 (+),score=80.18 TRINITY_DN593_c0_g2_i2:97-1539(+)
MYTSFQAFVLLSTLCLSRSSTLARNLKTQAVWQVDNGGTEVSLTANGRVEHLKPGPLMRKEAEDKTGSKLQPQDEGQKVDLQEDLEDLRAHSKIALRESDLDEGMANLLKAAADAKDQRPAEDDSRGGKRDFYEDVEDLSIAAAQASPQRPQRAERGVPVALHENMLKGKRSRPSRSYAFGPNLVRNSGFDDDIIAGSPAWIDGCPPELYKGHPDVVGSSCSSQGVYNGTAHNSGSPRANAWGLKSITDCYAGGRGGFYQDILTTPGVEYKVLYKVIDGFSEMRTSVAAASIIHVEVQSPIGVSVLDRANSIRGSGMLPATGNWELVGPYFFTASSAASRIFFYSGSYSCLFVDNVLVQSMTSGSADANSAVAPASSVVAPASSAVAPASSKSVFAHRVAVAPVWTETTTSQNIAVAPVWTETTTAKQHGRTLQWRQCGLKRRRQSSTLQWRQCGLKRRQRRTLQWRQCGLKRRQRNTLQ